jgi:hypothetical protein
MSDSSASGDDGPEYDTDFREHPDEYEIGRGEEGVLQPPFFRSGSLPTVAHRKIWTKKPRPRVARPR